MKGGRRGIIQLQKPNRPTTNAVSRLGFCGRVATLSRILTRAPDGEHLHRAGQQGQYPLDQAGHVGVRRVGGYRLVVGPAGGD